MRAHIRVRGAKAELHGVDPGPVLHECLRFPEPRHEQNPSFIRGDWDGMRELYVAREFPVGFVERVAAECRRQGHRVEITDRVETEPVDLQYLSDEYLVHPSIPDFRLRDHQLGGIEAVLRHMRGIVKSPTGSGKTEMIVAGARYLWDEFGHRSLIVVPKKGIAIQFAERANLYLQGDVEVGCLFDGHRDVGPITVATGQTLLGYRQRMVKRRMKPADPVLREVVREYEVLWYDECHRASSTSWYDIGLASNAIRRYGFSGTPIVEQDLQDARLEGVTGPVIYEALADDLIEHGYAAKPKIVMVAARGSSGPALPMALRDVRNPYTGRVIRKEKPLPYPEAYQQGVVENEAHNRAVVSATAWMAERGRQTIVLCRRKQHFQILSEMLAEAGVDHLAVWGSTDNSDRAHAKQAFRERTVPVVLATTIWDEGEDVPNVESIVLAEGVKSTTNSRQRIGRGMRADSDDCWVVDFAPTCHPTLIEHAAQRAEAYEGEGYEVLVLDEWPADHEVRPDLLPFETWTAAVDAAVETG